MTFYCPSVLLDITKTNVLLVYRDTYRDVTVITMKRDILTAALTVKETNNYSVSKCPATFDLRLIKTTSFRVARWFSNVLWFVLRSRRMNSSAFCCCCWTNYSLISQIWQPKWKKNLLFPHNNFAATKAMGKLLGTLILQGEYSWKLLF